MPPFLVQYHSSWKCLGIEDVRGRGSGGMISLLNLRNNWRMSSQGLRIMAVIGNFPWERHPIQVGSNSWNNSCPNVSRRKCRDASTDFDRIITYPNAEQLWNNSSSLSGSLLKEGQNYRWVRMKNEWEVAGFLHLIQHRSFLMIKHRPFWYFGTRHRPNLLCRCLSHNEVSKQEKCFQSWWNIRCSRHLPTPTPQTH